jgi:hypothetical protein
MAFCLAAIVLKRSGHRHRGLQSILEELVANTPSRHRDVAYTQYCGNNAYLQQVAVDTVLLPLARGEDVTQEGLDCLLAEFHRFRTAEGFFFDLPRHGTAQEPLHPPTYILKTLFLAGVCHELHPSEDLAQLFRDGMSSVLPLLTREGNFSYFGRTDNSPFATGLMIFDLRKATRLHAHRHREFDEACSSAERFQGRLRICGTVFAVFLRLRLARRLLVPGIGPACYWLGRDRPRSDKPGRQIRGPRCGKDDGGSP